MRNWVFCGGIGQEPDVEVTPDHQRPQHLVQPATARVGQRKGQLGASFSNLRRTVFRPSPEARAVAIVSALFRSQVVSRSIESGSVRGESTVSAHLGDRHGPAELPAAVREWRRRR